MTDVITMAELRCSWQEKFGANSIEILHQKSTGGGRTNRRKKKRKPLKSGGIAVTCLFKC